MYQKKKKKIQSDPRLSYQTHKKGNAAVQLYLGHFKPVLSVHIINNSMHTERALLALRHIFHKVILAYPRTSPDI